MNIISVTLLGIFRDRVLQGILVASFVFLAIPAVSTLSMRQVTELSLTLCLSLDSFLLLILAIFLGSVSLWRDMERRYTHGVLTLPVGRDRYLVGRFLGVCFFIVGTTILLGIMTVAVSSFVAANYPPERPVSWAAVITALGFEALQSVLLVAFAILFSTVSTSFFLPVFGTIAIYFVGGASQQAFDYVLSPSGQTLSPFVRQVTEILYYILPNFSAFDLKVNAIYSRPFDVAGLAFTAGYGLLYIAFVLIIAAAIYSRREIG